MGLVVFLVLFALVVLVILPLWVFVKIRTFASSNEVLETRLAALEHEIRQLRQDVQSSKAALVSTPLNVAPPSSPVTESQPLAVTPSVIPAPALTPPLVAPPPFAFPAPMSASAAAPPTARGSTPPPLPPDVTVRPPLTSPPVLPPAPPSSDRPGINWEQFMGAKLFAWLGGLAAFLAVAFFVKYSFEHDIIPVEVRVAIGFVLSAALIVGGLMMTARRFRITAQVLCATGVVSLYAVTFACNAVYHFPFFGTVVTFLLMTLITGTAFLLAVRMSAQVIAILGLLGGFLTPVLLSTGQDNPVGLFGFIALLDAGLIAVALHRSWFHLVPLAAAGTLLMQIGWAEKFFNVEKAPVAVIVCLGFSALFLAATEVARRFQRSSGYLTASAAVMALVSFGFAFYFQTYPTLGAQPGLLFSFVFATDALLLALVWRDERASRLPGLAGSIVFALLALWTARHLTDELLPFGLAAYLGFAVLHTAFPIVLQRFRPETVPGVWSRLYPPLALMLLLGPLLKSNDVSLLYWPAVLLVDIVAVVLAIVSGSVAALGLVLVFTLVAMSLSISRVAGGGWEVGSLLWVIAGFSLFFFAAGLFIARRLGTQMLAEAAGSRTARLFGSPAAQIPAFSALLPFILLIMMSQRLPMAVPTPLFGLALLCGVLVLGLSRLLVLAWLPLCGLVGVAGLAYAWHARSFDPASPAIPLYWYLGFYALFTVFPFAFRAVFAHSTGPWAVAALAGIVHFPLIHSVVQQSWPNDYPGLMPAAFALAPLVSLVVILRQTAADAAARLNQLAWFGGTTLLFITLVFPLQFERQWITISWALEGLALLWLFHRIPHPGLRATGVVLLIVAFVRLALNPAVLSYHLRSDTPVFNWYFYAYGVTVACLFLGARLLVPPAERVMGINVRPFLNAFGVILAFLLLNIEIADYFTPVGSVLTFQFSGNLARDLAYTVGWALFALLLLAVGIWQTARAARFAALALLSVTLLKLFFHDLEHLGQLYRVGALVVVAAVAILASFLYQRFIPTQDDPKQ